MPKPAFRARLGARLLGITLLGSAFSLSAHPARADQLTPEHEEREAIATSSIEELSYEAIIEPGKGYDATLRVRTALLNTSAREHDAVLSVALPRASQLLGLRVAQEGRWIEGRSTVVAAEPGRRDPGSAFARAIAPAGPSDLPGAEITLFSIPSGTTVQVELVVRVFPNLRGQAWELELPQRAKDVANLARDRSVLVRASERVPLPFFVDGTAVSDGQPFMSRPQLSATVTWAAPSSSQAQLDGHLEVMPAPAGPGGEFDLHVRLGLAKPLTPDHVIVLLDRSRSTESGMQRQTLRLLERVFDELPEATKFSLIGFARKPEFLSGDATEAASVRDPAARDRLLRILDGNRREQGTDIATAMVAAAEFSTASKAKRPLILVITDGMFPRTLEPERLRTRMHAVAHGRPHPDIAFIVDEPMLAASGIPADHAVARLASVVGARVNVSALGGIDAADARKLLTSPLVLGDLHVDLPRNAALETPLPSGVVAGSMLVLHGRYEGRSPTRVHLRGRLGQQKVRKTLRAKFRPVPPAALVGAFLPDTDVALAAREGHASPPWYSQRAQRIARQGITQAGRGGVQQKGRLDEKIFRHYLRTRVLPRARVCFNHAVARNQVLRGRVVLQFEVGKGEVMIAEPTQVELSDNDDLLLACLTEAAWALDIPSGKLDDNVYLVRYPLQLVPPRNGVAKSSVDPLGPGMIEELLER